MAKGLPKGLYAAAINQVNEKKYLPHNLYHQCKFYKHQETNYELKTSYEFMHNMRKRRGENQIQHKGNAAGVERAVCV